MITPMPAGLYVGAGEGVAHSSVISSLAAPVRSRSPWAPGTRPGPNGNLRVMVTILVCGYARGILASGHLEPACWKDVAFRVSVREFQLAQVCRCVPVPPPNTDEALGQVLRHRPLGDGPMGHSDSAPAA